MTKDLIRIVIAEDHALVREGTRRILDEQPDMAVVGQAGEGSRAVDMIRVRKPDVALLDVRMPGLNGIEATRQIREQVPDVAILILSAYDDDEYVSALLEAGASGYVLKTVGPDDLVDAVRRVHAGEIVFHPAVAAKLPRLWARAARLRGEGEQLTNREMDVLRLVCRGSLNKEIARELGVSVRTVEGHLSAILGKLGVRSRTEAAMYASSRNWFSEEDGCP